MTRGHNHENSFRSKLGTASYPDTAVSLSEAFKSIAPPVPRAFVVEGRIARCEHDYPCVTVPARDRARFAAVMRGVRRVIAFDLRRHQVLLGSLRFRSDGVVQVILQRHAWLIYGHGEEVMLYVVAEEDAMRGGRHGQ